MKKYILLYIMLLMNSMNLVSMHPPSLTCAPEPWRRSKLPTSLKLLRTDRNTGPQKVCDVKMLLENSMNLVGMEPKKRCDVCLENKSIYDFKPLSCCMHYASCTDCLLELINTSLQEKTVVNIKCPNRSCLKPITKQNIRTITDTHPGVYELFYEIATHECINNEKNIKQCPTPNCTYVLINDNALKQQFTCPSCKQVYCSNCLARHTQKTTCEQAKKERELAENHDLANRATQKWIKSNTKECPACHKPIQKNGGCNHMTCKQCNHQFCWTCRATFRTTKCNTTDCADPLAQYRRSIKERLRFFQNIQPNEPGYDTIQELGLIQILCVRLWFLEDTPRESDQYDIMVADLTVFFQELDILEEEIQESRNQIRAEENPNVSKSRLI